MSPAGFIRHRASVAQAAVLSSGRAHDAGSMAERCWAQGVALARQGHDAAALGALQRAVAAAPAVSLYWMNLASVQRRLRRPGEATASARRAFALDMGSVLACHLLAELLRLDHRHAEALQVLRSLAPETPRGARHCLLEGAVLMALGEWQDAAIAFLQVLATTPGDIEAYHQLAYAFARLRRFADAAECFRTVTMLEPAEIGAAVQAAHYADWACDWEAGAGDQARLARSLALQLGRDEVPAFSPFSLLAMKDDATQQLRAAARESERIARAARAAAVWRAPAAGPAGHPQAAQALRSGRTRVGFVAADFRQHATSTLLVQTLERLPRDRFEPVLYSNGADDGSALRQRMERAADRFVDCIEMSTVEQAARIRDDGIALLVDMGGFTLGNRLAVFALRPAPVQALWLGYPGTTGSDFIDYIVGDPVLTPLSHQADFSECIAQLPLCYAPTDDAREHPEPPSRRACGLPARAFVFACFNQSYKISELVFSRWCRILGRVPGSVLWLLVSEPEIQRRLRAAAGQRGIDPERLVFAPFVSPTEHLARLPQADLFLDTFPYGAHTTCSDALWMGLPVLTQIGRSFTTRVAASLLAAVGLPELVVDDAQSYEERAVALASTRRELRAIRNRLWDERRELPLFDNQRFTGELAALFERMVGRWQQGLPPAELPG